MKNKKGFTLIELLAVIVILAIIALIAVPVILNILDKSNKSAFKDAAYGVISAGELYFAEQQLELNGMSSNAEFTFPTDAIDIKGDVPAGTVLKVNTNGKVALAMSNGRYCVTKGYLDKDITITEDFEECTIPIEIKTFSELTTTEHACTAKGKKCTPGETLFEINVNDEEAYDFYVLNDDGNTVTLIMNGNLGDDVAWSVDSFEFREEDYDGDGVIDDWWNEYYNTSGPTTALAALKERTSAWENLKGYEYSYTLEDSNGVYSYSGEYVQEVVARLPRLSDITSTEIGCTKEILHSETRWTCPSWTYGGLFIASNGYWLSDAASEENDIAWTVNCYNVAATPRGYIYNDGGVRPVITLNK